MKNLNSLKSQLLLASALFLLPILLPIGVSAEITHPYTVDEKAQVMFGDSTPIEVGTTTYQGMENYRVDYVGGYAHITFTYTHHQCCYASNPPMVYVTDIDPRSTTTPSLQRDLSYPYWIRDLSVNVTDWYLYDIQFDPTGYSVSVRQATTTNYLTQSHWDIAGLTDTDWVSIANLYPMGNTIGYNSMSFTPFPLRDVPPAPKLNPVIIIPGIMGSAEKNGTWYIDPILHTYDDLLATLDANGYTEGVDLFTFPYQWRDSNVLTATLLKQKIDAVKGLCLDKKSLSEFSDKLDCNKVDIVAHSMGGLVAREYIEHGGYNDDIDQLIFLGTPHKGSPKAYLQWEAGENDTDLSSQITKSFFYAEAIKNGYSSVFNYIHNRPIISVEQLLPITWYLEEKDSGLLRQYPDNYPRNTFLEDLNNDVASLLNSGVKITNITGNSGSETIERIRVTSSTVGLWEHGEPDGFRDTLGDHGLERGEGDKTVTTLGSSLANLPPDFVSSTTHGRLPTVEAGRVFNILTGKIASTTIDNGFQLSPKVLIMQLLSPIDFVITTPDGKKIGKNFSAGTEYTEIPGAFYSGFETDREYITIPNPIDGEYKVETLGTGNGGSYGILTSYITDAGESTVEVSGTTLAGEVTKFKLNLVESNTNPIDVDLDAPNTATITISSPESKDYLRSEKINISAFAKTGILSLSLLGKSVYSGTLFDPFYAKLGTTTIYASSTIGTKVVATSSATFRIIASYESTMSDIERAYGLGWIYNSDTKNQLISRINKAIRGEEKIDSLETQKAGTKKITKTIEKLTKKMDKELLKAFRIDLDSYKKDKLNEQAYNIIKEDLEWLILNN